MLWRYLRTSVGWALLALVAGLGIVVVGVPALTGSTPLTVLTSSMEPTLPPGTLVVVRPTSVGDIRIGDVVTYQLTPNKPAVVSHRVIEVRSISTGETELITRGDNNGAADPSPVTSGQVRGIVWYSVPLVGWLSLLIGQHGSWLMPVVGAALLAYAAFLGLSSLAVRRRKSRKAAAAS
jgi:signal peptidase